MALYSSGVDGHSCDEGKVDVRTEMDLAGAQFIYEERLSMGCSTFYTTRTLVEEG